MKTENKLHTLKQCGGAHCRCMNLGNQCPHYHYADCESRPLETATTPPENTEELGEFVVKTCAMFRARSDGGGGLKDFKWTDFINEQLEYLRLLFLSRSRIAKEIEEMLTDEPLYVGKTQYEFYKGDIRWVYNEALTDLLTRLGITSEDLSSKD